MKTIEHVIDNYKEYETFLDDRFGVRFCSFLTPEQAEKIGYKFKEPENHTPTPWTEEEILKLLKDDVEFGWEKCINQRGISSELMGYVVQAWCKVLENGLENTPGGDYNNNLFRTVAEHYGWELEEC